MSVINSSVSAPITILSDSTNLSSSVTSPTVAAATTALATSNPDAPISLQEKSVTDIKDNSCVKSGCRDFWRIVLVAVIIISAIVLGTAVFGGQPALEVLGGFCLLSLFIGLLACQGQAESCCNSSPPPND